MDDDELLEALRMLFGPHVDRERLLNARLFDPQRRWVDPGGYRLSDRIWRNGQRYRATIDAILREGIRRGDSAETIARKLRAFVNPEYAPIRYQKNGRVLRVKGVAQRPNAASASRALARTEIQRVHGEGAKDRARASGAAGMRWRLSLNHPKIDRCDDHANADLHDMGKGVYPIDELPTYPDHPNCMCTLLPFHRPREETRSSIADKYRHRIFTDVFGEGYGE